MELLNHYSFDLNTGTSEQLVSQWSHHYQVHWIRSAVIEALYQGRYKAVSVEQILAFWYRRGQPLCHFNHEFERIVCGNFIRNRAIKVETPVEEAWIPPTHTEGSSSHLTQPTFPHVPKANTQLKVQRIDPGFEIATDLSLLNPVSNRLNPLKPSQDSSLGDAEIKETATEANSHQAISPNAAPEKSPLNLECANSSMNVKPVLEGETALDPVPNSPTSDQQTNLEVIEQGTSIPFPNQLAELDQSPSHPSLADPLSGASFLEKPVPVFQPHLRLGAKSPERGSWSRTQAAKYPIHQFIPALEPSVFYAKLKAVAQALRASGE
ncbi:MAG: hypothetical protein VKJ46_01000 [Leptolyngbyaceae bacterium]|nr:hypothetical protein [Leptolyngbyaceae bacterium]